MSEQDVRAEHARLTGFLQRMRPEPRMAFLAVRALALSLGPDVVERVESGEVAYLRRTRPFVSVRSARGPPTLAFPEDVPLEDPMGRLLRRGVDRYVALDSSDALDGHVQEFIRKAYAARR